MARQGLFPKALYTTLRAARRRFKNVRFFECGAYARLIGSLRYDVQALSFVVVFVLYDVDLFFFFSEVLMNEWWGPQQLILAGTYLALFVAGLWYDISRQGLTWAY